MTEQNESDTSTAAQMPVAEIEFQGRTLMVTLPDPTQLLVWKRTLVRLQNANTSNWTGADVMAALERLRVIIDTLIVDDADKQWIDDQLLNKSFGLAELAQLPTLAAQAFSTPNNREERRAAAAKKTTTARRRAPAKKTTGGKK